MARADDAGAGSPPESRAGPSPAAGRGWRRHLLPAALLLLALPLALEAGRRLPASLVGVQAEALTATWKASGADADWEAALAARERQLAWFPDPVAQQRTARLLLDRAQALAEASLSRAPADASLLRDRYGSRLRHDDLDTIVRASLDWERTLDATPSDDRPDPFEAIHRHGTSVDYWDGEA